MRLPSITKRVGGASTRRRLVAGATLIVVAAVIIGVVLGAGSPAASQGQGNQSTATGATTVQRRDLVETDTESGTLGYSNAQTVFNRLSGTITYLPAVGQVVHPGGTLYQVNGYPVVLFSGSYPAYRDLKSGDSDGPDVEELNRDLKAMGFDPYDAITVDDAWQAATTDAVERFQESIGQKQTGKLTLGRIVFLPGAQLINAVDTTVGSTGTGGGSSPGSSDSNADDSDPTSTPSNASYKPTSRPHPEFVELTPAKPPTQGTGTPGTRGTPGGGNPGGGNPFPAGTGTTPSGNSGTPTTPTSTTPSSTSPGSSSDSSLQAIIQLLRTQNQLLQAQLRSALEGNGSKSPSGNGSKSPSSSGNKSPSSSGSHSPSSSGSHSPSSSGDHSPSGNSGADANATAILSTTSTQLVVTVDLDATKQSEAKVHEPVTVQLPDGSTVGGRITQVSPVATNTNSGSNSNNPSANAPSATIPVTVALDKHADTRGLDQAAVSVNFEQAVARHVLSVPVTALLATQGGGYAVQVASAPHKLVSVTPGLFAAGYVQISGSGIYSGMQVTDSQG